MAKHISYGIIGCGMMGQEHLRNIALLPDVGVAAIFEPDAMMRARAAGFAPQASIAGSVAEVAADPRVDCLLIASPNYVHFAQLKEIAAIRALPILVEKPLFTDPVDAAAVKAFAATYTAPVWVAMEYRYMPPVARFIEQAQNATGGIRMLTIREHRYPFLDKVAHWNRFNRRSGGTFVEKCCHFFDLMRLILKSEPVRIMASAGQEVNHLNQRYDGETPDIWDCGYVLVDFASGARAMLELCMYAEGSRYQEEISAVGARGKVECLVPGPGRFWPAHLGAAPTPQLIVSPRFPRGPYTVEIPVDPQLLTAGDHNGSTFYQHQRFCAALRDEGPVEVTLDDGWKAVAMGMAAQVSASQGTAISNPLDACESAQCG
ncbi:MAG: Gfo/Idh/MocA family oxidoreductase [Mesorhizobium sp.]|uniref:Gfo/Idh/MocA family protein n=1 Tax=unclassified Mesorhizobium TaxID=325217 RepID=UPI000FE92F5E|nr:MULTISPECIES: Gfo/Idh/MocA family oxidoreductase [unclassified Mesorhizobium]RWC09361.1 MAG: Gfo/Idh/MocA family oxidoreductase [Mesorhizobium sp.]TGU00698.1 Gfo/Idh/MocA family oxidoreductase [Mesorhizobium sp. M5C.F.Ca.ET.164.01.1.1]